MHQAVRHDEKPRFLEEELKRPAARIDLIIMGADRERPQFVGVAIIPIPANYGDVADVDLRCEWFGACFFVTTFRAVRNDEPGEFACQILDLEQACLTRIAGQRNPDADAIDRRRFRDQGLDFVGCPPASA